MSPDEAFAVAMERLERFAEWEGAIALLRQIIDVAPGHARAMGALGALLVHTSPERLDEGSRLIRQAIETVPEPARIALGIGDVFLGQGAFDNALRAYRLALHFAPGDRDAARRLEIARLGEGPPAGGLDDLDRGELLLLGRGILFGDDRPADALVLLSRLLEIDPDSVAGLRLSAMALNLMGRPAEALDHGLKARRLDPPSKPHPADDTDLSVYAMGAGRFDLAWEFIEARLAEGWGRHLTPKRAFPMPRWQGEDLVGRTILVWREDGLGDELIYSSCVPDLAAAGARVIFECHPRLLSLFTRAFADMIVRPAPLEEDEAVDYSGIDCHIPLESLMGHFRRTLADFPRRAHLTPDSKKAALWRQRLKALGPGRKIGIGWKSGRSNPLRDRYYSALIDWEPLLRLPGSQIISLQYGDCEDEILAAEAALGITIHRWDDLDLFNDFEGQAALLAGLDWMVAAPITPLMLSGALGTRSILVSCLPNPKALGQTFYPWYQDARCLYRAHDQGDRRALLARAAAMIEAEA